MAGWKRNLYVLCAVQFLTLVGFSSYTTFIPYYLQELGLRGEEAAMSWTAAIQTGGALSMMVAAPLWGSLADRYGRKMMLVRATSAAILIATLMGFAQNPTQLLILRILQGAFSGTMAAAMTLVATGTPDKALGQSMGTMTMIQHLSHALGPLLGGMAADALGYRAVFRWAAVVMLCSLSVTILLVRETRSAEAPRVRRREPFRLSNIKHVADTSSLILIGAIAGTSLAFSTLSPVMALYIQSLDPGSERLATLAGAVTSVSAITSSVAAISIGRLGDRIGQKKALLIGTLGVAVMAIPQTLVNSAAQLAVLRAVHGVFVGGIMPTANALLARATPPERRGAILGLSSGAQSGGRALGPTLGAGVAGIWGMESAFYLNASIFLILSLLVAKFVHVRPRPAAAPAAEAAEAPRPAPGAEARPGV